MVGPLCPRPDHLPHRTGTALVRHQLQAPLRPAIMDISEELPPVHNNNVAFNGMQSRSAYYQLGIILGALGALGPLAIDMYLPSFPTIASELGTEQSAVQITVAVYFVGLAIGQAFYGPITDRVGRKLPLHFGLILFIASSVGCALAGSIEVLIAFRFLQALGGCAEMVIARAVVRDRFDERESVRMLSLLMLVMGVAPILAPMIGGYLLAGFGWRSVFWVLAGFATLCLLATTLLLPESLPPERRNKHGLGTILRTYGTLLSDARFMVYVLSGSLIMAGMFAYIAASPFVFMDIYGVSPGHYGLFFGTNALGLILASQINGRLARRLHAGTILRVALTVAAGAGLLLLVTAATGTGGFAGILLPLFIFVASLGFILPNSTALAMAPHGRAAGSASALLGTIQFLAGAAAGALVGIFNDGTVLPMALVIAGCGVAAYLIHLLSIRTSRR